MALAGTRVPGASGHVHVGLLHQGIVDHVDVSVGALDVRPEHVDPSVAPEDLVSWKRCGWELVEES